MYLRGCLFILLLSLCTPRVSLAWGPDGHRITGNVAYHLLDQKTKDSVKYYLGDLKLEDATNWMDEMRSNPQFDYMKPWHYINIDRGHSYDSTQTDNIIFELNKVMVRLKERNKHTKDEIAVDLKILAHLMGDLHQPLHCGYGVDTGGNAILVKFFTWQSNLHRVWDSEIITQLNLNAKDCLSMVAKFSKGEAMKYKNGNFVSWLYESRSYLPRVYDFKNNNITDQYALKNSPVVEKQLALSGLRMAELLKEIFESK
jgi:hypothetical protein